jgi:hypothetical protein
MAAIDTNGATSTPAQFAGAVAFAGATGWAAGFGVRKKNHQTAKAITISRIRPRRRRFFFAASASPAASFDMNRILVHKGCQALVYGRMLGVQCYPR